jgi:hypothetical protein
MGLTSLPLQQQIDFICLTLKLFSTPSRHRILFMIVVCSIN